MPTYSPEQARRLREQFVGVNEDLVRTYLKTIVFGQSRLQAQDARKYMVQGVARRLASIRHSLARIFEAFPPEAVSPLGRERLEEVNIHLQAFVLHVNALQDNFAWAFVHEYGLQLDRHDVSLFRKPLKRRLPQAIRTYLGRQDVSNWRTQYSTDFRDALAHRIPLYVPPSQLTRVEGERAAELQRNFNEAGERGDWEALIAAQEALNALGEACPYFLHDASGQQLILHPQILSDGMTVAEFVTVMLDHWPETLDPTTPP